MDTIRKLRITQISWVSATLLDEIENSRKNEKISRNIWKKCALAEAKMICFTCKYWNLDANFDQNSNIRLEISIEIQLYALRTQF